MSPVVLYRTRTCSYCAAAERYLREVKGVEAVAIDLTNDREGREALAQRTGRTSVPQIFVGDRWVGGYQELRDLDRAGGLDPLLNADR
jgi:glutaredoxin 3